MNTDNNEIKEPFEEFGDVELAYRIASFGLLHPNEKEIKKFLLAAKEYKKAARKLIRYLKEEIRSTDALVDAVLEDDADEQMLQEEGNVHD